MMILRLRGGLGNQLFSYSAARQLALVSGASLVVDTVTGFRSDRTYRRAYLLGQFRIIAVPAPRGWRLDFPGGHLVRFALKRVSRCLPPNMRPYLEDQKNRQFEPWFTAVRPRRSVWVEGYFQSPKYFEDISDVIRREFRPVKEPDPVALAERKLIEREPESVALGVRLYQEVTQPGKHTVLGREYYLRAAETMNARLRQPHYFIFCNDRQWVTEHLRWPYPHTVIEPKPRNEDAYQDLWLMTACKHFIIPNSTFHWWGAWLAANEQKIVIAPSKGFPNRDTIPDSWVKVPV